MANYWTFTDGISINNYIKSIPIFENRRNTLPLVTIAIPTFNRVDTLRQALQSALNQEYDDYEVIVVDNNPVRGDETELFMLTMCGCDNLSYYKNEKNIGLYGNWNRCFELSRTKWVTLLHDDDYYFPEYLSTMMGTLENNPDIDALSCRLYFWKEDEHETQIDVIDRTLFHKPRGIVSIPNNAFLLSHPVGPVGIVFKKCCWKEIGGFNSEFYPIADYVYDWKYYNAFCFKELNTCLAHYRIGMNVSYKPEIKELQERKNYELRLEYLSLKGSCKFVYNIIEIYQKSELEFLAAKYPDYPLKDICYVSRWNIYKILIKLYYNYLKVRRLINSSFSGFYGQKGKEL